MLAASNKQPKTAAESEPEKQLELNSQQTQQGQQYSQPNQTVKQKEELAIALVKQKKNQRQINQRLRTMRGRLAVLTDQNTLCVYAIEFGKKRTQQEKLVIRQTETGVKILKDELNDNQRGKLFQVLNELEQQNLVSKDS